MAQVLRHTLTNDQITHIIDALKTHHNKYTAQDKKVQSASDPQHYKIALDLQNLLYMFENIHRASITFIKT